MKEIIFLAAFSEQQKEVRVTQPNGAGNDFQVFVEKYYQGVLVKLKGEWVGHLNPNSLLTADDILILGEMIDLALKY